MGSPHPILDGTQALSPQVSVSFKPAHFEIRGHREAAKKTGAKLELTYRHRDRFRFSSTYKSLVVGSGTLIKFWRGRDQPQSLTKAQVEEVTVVQSTRFERFSVIARVAKVEVPIIDDIDDREDADQLAQCLREFLALEDAEPDSRVMADLDKPRRGNLDLHPGNSGQLSFTNRWFHSGHLAALFFIGSITTIIALSLQETGATLHAAGLLTLGAAFCYPFAAGVINRSRGVIEKNRMRIQHGPLPWPRSPQVPIGVIKRVLQRSNGSAPAYSVYVETLNEAGIKSSIRIARSLDQKEAVALVSAVQDALLLRKRTQGSARARVAKGGAGDDEDLEQTVDSEPREQNRAH